MKKKEIKALIDDITSGGDKLGVMTRDFPDSMKGKIAKSIWDDDKFSYGREYGALIILNYFLKTHSSNRKAIDK